MSDRRMRGLEADTSTIDAYNAEHKKYIYDTDKKHNVYRVGAKTPGNDNGGELLHFVMTRNKTSQTDLGLRYEVISPVGNVAISGDITVSVSRFIGISAGAARISYPSSGVVSIMDADFGIGTETPSEQFVLYKAGGGNALEIQSTATTTRLSQNRLALDMGDSEGGSDIQFSNNAAQIYYDDSALYLGTNIDTPVYLMQNRARVIALPSAGNVKILGLGSPTLTFEDTGSTNTASISFNGTDLIHTNNNGLTRINGSGGTAASSTVKLLVNGAAQVTSSTTPIMYFYAQTDGDSGSLEFDSASYAIKCRVNGGSEIFSAANDGIFRVGAPLVGSGAWEGAYIRENVRGGNLQISNSNISGRVGPVLYFLETHNGDSSSLNFTGSSLKYSLNEVELFKTNGAPINTQADVSSSSVGLLVDGYGSDLTSNVFVGNTNYGLQVIPNTSLSIRSGGVDKIKIDNTGTTTVYNNLFVQSSSYVSNYHNTLAAGTGDTRLKQYGGGNVIVGLEPESGGHNTTQLIVYGPVIPSNYIVIPTISEPADPVIGTMYYSSVDGLKIFTEEGWKVVTVS